MTPDKRSPLWHAHAHLTRILLDKDVFAHYHAYGIFTQAEHVPRKRIRRLGLRKGLRKIFTTNFPPQNLI